MKSLLSHCVYNKIHKDLLDGKFKSINKVPMLFLLFNEGKPICVNFRPFK